MDFEHGWLNMTMGKIRERCTLAKRINVEIMRGAAVCEIISLLNSEDEANLEISDRYPMEFQAMQKHAFDVIQFCDDWLAIPF